jgi:tRNA threonylcarbamoyladenosine biosynthesis protein TsaB
MAESLLKNLGITASEIDLVAVSRGPGSFTGVRIGVAAAKGLAWGLDKPACGVSTLEAMAYQTPEPGAILCPVMDAKRGQVYNALFQWLEDKLIRICDDRAISLESLSTELRTHTTPLPPYNATIPSLDSQTAAAAIPPASYNSPLTAILSPLTPPPCLLIGDGAAISLEYLTSAGIPCRIAPSLLRYQTAYGAALAAQNSKLTPAIDLEPTYLRPSQAERERTQL